MKEKIKNTTKKLTVSIIITMMIAMIIFGNTSNVEASLERLNETQFPYYKVFKEIATGEQNTIAIDEYGNLWAWGKNQDGSLGVGSDDNSLIYSSPVQITEGTTYKAVSSGTNFSVALDTSGNMWAWGSILKYTKQNEHYTYDTISINIPTKITITGTSVTFSKIAAGSSHVLALDTTGKIWQFNGKTYPTGTSSSTYGNLTNNSDITQKNVENTTFTEISAGDEFSLALDTEGHIWSWGNNLYGQLGRSCQPKYTTLSQLETYRARWGGQGDSSSASSDGVLNAYNAYVDAYNNWPGLTGSLNYSNPVTNYSSGIHGTVYVSRSYSSGLEGMKSVTFSADYIATNISINSDGSYSMDIEITNTSPSPVSMPYYGGLSSQGTDRVNVYSNMSESDWKREAREEVENRLRNELGTKLDGYWLKKDNQYFSLISGKFYTEEQYNMYQNYSTLYAYITAKNLQNIQFEGNTSLSKSTKEGYKDPNSDSYYLSFIDKNNNQQWYLIKNISNTNARITKTSAPQVYDPTTGERLTSVIFINYNGYCQIKEGRFIKLSDILTAEFQETYSGSNTYTYENITVYDSPSAEGGVNGGVDTTPFKINSSNKFIHISCGTNHAIALDENGKIWTWGDNAFGQGQNSRNKYDTIYFNDYRLDDLPGDSSFNPTTVTCAESFLIPTIVNNIGTCAQVSAGNGYNLAIDSNGYIWSWGKNNLGQLGIGNVSDVEEEPTKVNGNTKYCKIFAGNDYSMALAEDYKLYGFGSDLYGQLGINVGRVDDENGSIFSQDELDSEGSNHYTITRDISTGTYSTNKSGYSNMKFYYDSTIGQYYNCTYYNYYHSNNGYVTERGNSKYYYNKPLQITNVNFGKYRIEYYIENTDNTNFSVAETVYGQEPLKENTVVVAPIKTYTGCTFIPNHGENVLSGSVPGNGELVLKVYYERNRYDVILDSDGGTPYSGKTYKYGKGWSSSDFPTPTKYGYTFIGWKNPNNMDGANITSISASATGTKNFKAKWEAKRIYLSNDVQIVIYKENTAKTGYDYTASNPSETSGTTYHTGDLYTVTPENIEGFTFNSSDSRNVLSKNLEYGVLNVFKMYYTRNTYTISLETNGGRINSGNVTSYTYGVGATLPTNVTRAGYDFGGWYAPKGTSAVTSIGPQEIGNKSFVARWIPRDDTPYKIIHKKEKTTLGQYEVVETENKVGTTESAVSATPRHYEGFQEATANPNTRTAGNIVGDGSLEIILYYDRIRYPVTLNTEGGRINSGNITEYAHGVGATLPTNVTRGGYNFLGWHNSSGSKILRIENTETGPKTYNAWWEPRTDTPYKVEHYIENTNLEYVKDTTESKTGTTGTTVRAVEKDYGNHYYKAIDNPSSIMEGMISGDEELVLKLYYKRIRYKVTLDPNGGTIANGKNITEYAIDVGVSKLPDATEITRIGYDFAGWHNPENMDGQAITKINSSETGDKNFKAKWIPRNDTAYKVEYYFENTDLTTYTKDNSKTENKIGTTEQIVSAEIKEFEGYTFNSEYADNNLSDAIKGDGSTTLKVYYKRTRYPVTLDARGGTIVEGKNITEYAHGVGISQLPTEDDIIYPGYEFLGWYDLDDLNGGPKTSIPATTVGEKKYRARWSQGINTPYTIQCYGQKLASNEYELIKTIDKHGITDDTVTIEEIIEIPGFVFDSSNSQNIMQGVIKGDGSLALKLYYNRGRYTVTLNTNGGTINSGNITEYSYGEEKTLPTNVTKNGSTFLGWYDETKEISERVTTITETTYGNLVFVAHWDDTIETEDYTVIESNGIKYITEIEAPTTVDELLDKITSDGTMHVEDGKTNRIMDGSELVKTGDILVVEEDGETYRYTLIVIGDVNRDGYFNITDLSTLIYYEIGQIDLSIESKLAGDFNKDYILNLIDVSLMCRRLIEIA